MRAWPGVEVPDLPGTGPRPFVHDTATGRLRPVPAAGRDGGEVRVYVCGITPYDATHLGHAATYLVFDTLNRVLTDAGFRVRYAQNVTDVDEPLLERATATGRDWVELAQEQTDLFRADMTALRVLPPDSYVGAVEAIPLITAGVARLLAAGAVYQVEQDLYFSTAADPVFGEVSHLPAAAMAELAAANGGNPDRPGKNDPLDPVVWRAQRPGEPSWDSEFGPGRPGWHLECAAISLDRLRGAAPGQPSVDVQGGGSDLVFPHHEMCAAQARALTGAPFADVYLHAGLLGLDGEKMSKSRGNLVFVSRLLADGVEPAAVRLALLAGHPRAARPWTSQLVLDAERRLARWRAAVGPRPAADAPTGPRGDPADSSAAGADVLHEVRRRLADDLDTPGALAAVDAWTGQTDLAAGPVVRDLVDALFGIVL